MNEERVEREREKKSPEDSGEDKVNSGHGNRKRQRVVGRTTRSPRPDEEAKC